MFEFRRYKIKQGNKQVRHPKLIVDETDTEYGFLGLTSRKQKGKRHNNFPLFVNPKLSRKGSHFTEESYLRKKVEYDKKTKFGSPLPGYALSEIDEMRIRDFIKNKLGKK